MKKQKLRVAVIGLGKMGLLHSSLLNVFSNVELVALCDKSKLLNRLYKKIFSPTGVLVVNDIDKLAGLDLDVAYVTTPISSHSSIVKTLYEKEIARHLFVEKALATNYEQAKEMCELAKNSDSITMVGYMKRFSVVFGKAKELLQQGNLGKIKSFKAYAYSSDFLGLTKESMSSASRGGALRDIGCHIIDLSLWILGDFDVQNVLSSTRNETGSELSVSFTVTNSAGLSGQINVSQQMPNYRMPEFGLFIKCSDGTIDVNDDRLLLTSSDGTQQKWYRHDLNDNVYFSIGDAEYFRENQHFVNSLLENKHCEPNFETSSKVDYIIEQVKTRSEQ
ncbi:MAG: Gfo/Idh/MocA family oxidoreductase [Candidatus Bathyarchaeota archaeon]|nr:Gfo/Idh/MocA family oxidoreductase [Candidatus Bathyarchaeum sp.]